MAFISYEQREDFQDDTFKMVAGLVARAVEAQLNKNLTDLFDSVDAIDTLLHKRIKDYPSFEHDLEELRVLVYSDAERDDYSRTQLFDRVRRLSKKLMGALDDGGLLLRERLDKSELVTRE